MAGWSSSPRRGGMRATLPTPPSSNSVPCVCVCPAAATTPPAPPTPRPFITEEEGRGGLVGAALTLTLIAVVILVREWILKRIDSRVESRVKERSYDNDPAPHQGPSAGGARRRRVAAAARRAGANKAKRRLPHDEHVIDVATDDSDYGTLHRDRATGHARRRSLSNKEDEEDLAAAGRFARAAACFLMGGGERKSGKAVANKNTGETDKPLRDPTPKPRVHEKPSSSVRRLASGAPRQANAIGSSPGNLLAQLAVEEQACKMPAFKLYPNGDTPATEVSRYAKPKKDVETMIQPADYVCTPYDDEVINLVKDMPADGEFILVHFDDGAAMVRRKHMECLFHHSGEEGYLNDEVINAYIEILRATKHLRARKGGSVVLEASFIPPMMQQDGNEMVKMEDMYPLADNDLRRALIKRVKTYLNADMVFLPINILKKHWYLAVINGKKGQIQILDSMGEGVRKELRLTLAGLQKEINFVMENCELLNHKWKNLRVEDWPMEEIDLGISTQDDDCSCGLFMLNYMEYWTGEDLSDSFDQDNMAHFRSKLIAILMTDKLNTYKGCSYIDVCPDEDGSTDDVQFIEKDYSPWKSQQSVITDGSAAAERDGDQPDV